jgi:MFS family permease
MVGPAVGVWAATLWPTAWVLFTIEMVGVAAGVLLWIANPAIREAEDETVVAETTPGETAGGRAAGGRAAGRPPAAAAVPRADWFRARFVAICLGAAATTVVLGGSDIAIVAALRAFDAQSSIGWVLAIWGLGSLIGGLVYGGLHRSISAFSLLGGLSIATAPMALAAGAPSLAVLAFVAGLLCAPTITATVDQVSRVVPPSARGEAMGWHGSFMTAGLALGAPAAGVAIDLWGWGAGFALVALIGLAVASAGAGVTRVRRRRVLAAGAA